MNRALLVCAAVLAVSGCDASEPSGEPAVLQRIEVLTECEAIQEEFDTAWSNSQSSDPGTAQHQAALSYMEAADSRLAAVGCYE